MPDASSRPYRMFLPLIVVLILAALWTAYWFIAASFAQGEAARQRQALAERGVTLACTEETWGGFPFRFEFACQSPVLTVRDRAEAASARLLLVALAYNPWQVVALLDGPTTVTAAGLLPRKAEHQRLVAAVTLGRNNGVSISAEVPGIAIEGLGKSGKVMLHTRPSPRGLADIAVSFAGLNYQPEGRPPLEVDNGSLRATASETLTLIVDSIELQRGTVRYWGSGTVSLDAKRRISGQLATGTNDLDGLLAILEPHLDMNESDKAVLRTMLGLLGNEAKAPVIAKDGNLLIGPFKIADLVPLY